jgi:hypothetical protein
LNKGVKQMSEFIIYDGELYHHGVKGMKWGVRKDRKSYVTTFQAKRNAARAANEARKKSIADSRANGPKGIGSFQKANRKALAAKRKAYDESMARDRAHNEQLKLTKKGEYKARKVLTRAGTAFLTDKFMNEGVVTNAVSAATVQAGRAAVTAVVMARGGHDIKWYDKKGNRVG